MSELLGPYELNTIVTGDARELAKAIPDESVDLIFTDPVYDRIDDYRWLAETAQRVLKPNSAVLCWCAIGNIPATHWALGEFLNYRWRLIIRPVNSKEFNGRLLITSQECLWYEKGKSHLYASVFDVQMSVTKGGYDVSGANWGKGVYALTRYLEAFTKPDMVVLDPFGGSGSVPAVCKMLGRHYLAFEIDTEVAECARQRVLNTQPPLFVPEADQLDMFA